MGLCGLCGVVSIRLSAASRRLTVSSSEWVSSLGSCDMADLHIPDLDAIRALPNRDIQFYAAVGAVMSLHARLEQDYFLVFEAASGLGRKRAARVFYKVRSASTRREQASEAIMPTLNDEGASQWQAIYDQIVKVTGKRGHRNFLGHCYVSYEPESEGIFDEAIFDSEIFDTGSNERFFVSQDEIQILAGQEKPREEDFDSTINYCRLLIDLLNSIAEFLDLYKRGDFTRK